MTDYTSLANAIKTTLQADPWIGNLVNVKTIETYKRDFSLQGEEGPSFYKEEELPAMGIIPNASPKLQEDHTVGELLEEINPEIITVSFGPDLPSAPQEHDEIIGNLERVLEAQNKSAVALGIDAYVKNISTITERDKKDKNYIYFSRTSFTVSLTTIY